MTSGIIWMGVRVELDGSGFSDRLAAVLHYATVAHAGQLRKGLPEPYIVHPVRVAEKARVAGLSEDAILAALLHDVVEDTPVTLDEVATIAPPRAVHLVRLLSKWWSDDTPEDLKRIYKRAYYAAIETDFEAIALKKLDRADNLLDMVRVTAAKPKWALKYLRKTRDEVLLLPRSLPIVDARLAEAVTAAESALTKVGESPFYS